MSTSLVNQDFFGKPVSFHALEGGELWLTAGQASVPLGLAHARKVRQLFQNHAGEFIEGVEFSRPTLEIACSGPSQGPTRTQKKKTLVFSLAGLDHLALLVRNEAGVKLRRWTVDLRASLRAREKAIVDPQKIAEKVAVLETMLAAAHANHLADLRRMAEQLLASNEVMASALGTAMAHRKHQKARERALKAELDIGQKFLPGINGNGSPVNRLPEN